MKKKVLIIMPSMFIGGAERSLIGLLDAFDYDSYDVSLFLYRHEGEFLPYINKSVHILPEMEEYRTFDVPIKSLLFSRKFIYGLRRLKAKVDQRIHAYSHPDENGLWMHLQKISGNLQSILADIPGRYDLGIMFLSVPDTLVNHVDAKVKICWNHTDYTIQGPDIKYDHTIYDQLDGIVSVSSKSRDQFLKVYPEYAGKAFVIENVLSEDLLLKQSMEPVNDMNSDPDQIKILSIGRYCEAKNFDNVPDICRRVLNNGINIKWFIIGYGGDETLIKNKIRDCKMENNVILLGKKNNPYPYIKNCDVYIQPSRYEGKSVTVREAQILGKPVIVTNYATASDQLTDGYDGLIVPLENEQCALAISKILKNKELLEKISANTLKKDYTNRLEILKIYDLLQ